MGNRFEGAPLPADNEKPEDFPADEQPDNPEQQAAQPLETSPTGEVMEKDSAEFKQWIKKTESDILTNIIARGEGNFAEELIQQTEGYAQEQTARIDKEADEWLKDLPVDVEKLANDPAAVHSLAERADMKDADMKEAILKITRQLGKEKFRDWLRDTYTARRLSAYTNRAPEIETKGEQEPKGPDWLDKQSPDFQERVKKYIQEKKLSSASFAASELHSELFLKHHLELDEPTIEKLLHRLVGEDVDLTETPATKQAEKIIFEKMSQAIEHEVRAENPFEEITSRLERAQAQLLQEGLGEDANQVGLIIQRVESVRQKGQMPYPILLWAESTWPPQEKRNKVLKFFDKLLDKTTGSQTVPPDYVREHGGKILRANGQWDSFWPNTQFKDTLKKVKTPYDLLAPQPGDEVVSWAPSGRAKEILLQEFGTGKLEPGAVNELNTNIIYKDPEGFESEVRFEAATGVDNMETAYLTFKTTPAADAPKSWDSI